MLFLIEKGYSLQFLTYQFCFQISYFKNDKKLHIYEVITLHKILALFVVIIFIHCNVKMFCLYCEI